MTSHSEKRDVTALPPHDHTIEPGEINRRGCERCEIEGERRNISALKFAKAYPSAQEAFALAQRIEERYPDWIRREEAQNALVNLAQYVEDQQAMIAQTIETLRDLHANWKRIIDEQDDDGEPLIENLLYWAIEDLGGHE